MSIGEESWASLTPWVCGTVEDDWSVLVILVSQNIVELDGEAVEVTNVQRAEIVVKGVVEERVIDGEVAWRVLALG